MSRFLFLCLFLTCSLPAQDLSAFLAPDLAEGFDFPVGGPDGTAGYTDLATKRRYKSWKTETQVIDALSLEAQETSNGSGGADTDANQPVHAMAAGTVTEVKDGEVWLEHHYLENGQPQHLLTGYTGIHACTLKPGDPVKRRQPIAKIAPGSHDAPAHLTLTLRHLLYAEAATWPTSVSSFIRSHRHLLVPAKEERVIIAIKHAYQLHVCEKGQAKLTLPMALGQDGRRRKTTDGDNRTPVGEYRITQKSKGPFDGTYGAYLGAAWLRLNYPNAYDARTALSEKRITQKQHDHITTAAHHGSMAPRGTPLGDGIGIHGWISDWPDGPHHLTWGCLSLRKADLLQLHDLVSKGTRVLIVP
ncbi:L,D-transpeptidase family protein [Prosthecobacter sp.]|uniref:L,D-transpeptidase family protein n=1 Tax=Prosthecobacter sp. TaxID=1965333 RepID=UPI00378452CE